MQGSNPRDPINTMLNRGFGINYNLGMATPVLPLTIPKLSAFRVLLKKKSGN